jgi:hypothetical protein
MEPISKQIRKLDYNKPNTEGQKKEIIKLKIKKDQKQVTRVNLYRWLTQRCGPEQFS